MFDTVQTSLFGSSEVGFDESFETLRRIRLGSDAWIDYAPTWLHGDELLFASIHEAASWSSPEVKMYDKVVKTPRLTAQLQADADPIVPLIVAALSTRYDRKLYKVSAGLYRSGADSVAWHGDRIARDLPESIVATVSLCGPRRFLLRPKGGGRSRSFTLGHGDLVVMGGSCQRTWEHAVPKVAHAQPRIALMFRHDYPPSS